MLNDAVLFLSSGVQTSVSAPWMCSQECWYMGGMLV